MSAFPGENVEPAYANRFEDAGEGLRTRTARGTLVNAAFMVGLQTLSLLKGFLVAAFLTTQEYGVWGILVVSLGTLGLLKEVGVVDKYVQQEEEDQELAFQRAFTLELMLNGLLLLLILAALPLFALAYGQWQILAPGALLALAVPAVALQAPLWVFYRRMRFVQQRALQAIDPIASFAVTIALAAAGLGYWSLVVGVIAGAWAGAIAAVLASPYPLGLRYDRGTLREYAGFSWPLFLAGGSGILIAQAATLAGEAALGLAGVGVIALASSITLYTDRVDAIVTQTLYPAICAVRDRADLLYESFVKSNRLALMWGVPFGVGLALFAPDLVEFVIGERWEPAVGLLQAFGLIAAANHVGFNWTAFYRARGDTRPIAIVHGGQAVLFVAIAVPLLLSDGTSGLAIGMAIVAAAGLAGRAWYLTRLFPGFGMVAHTARAMAPTAPAVAAVLLARAGFEGDRSGAQAGAELALYIAVTVAATLVFERALLREVAGYLRRFGGSSVGAGSRTRSSGT